MADRNARIGRIIRIIANQPGITMGKLLASLGSEGIIITERTLAKDIFLLKHEYGLLPQKERLRGGYMLEGMLTLSRQEIDLVLDAMHVFGVRLNDPEAEILLKRIAPLKDAGNTGSRTIRQRNIYKSVGTGKEVENLLLCAVRSRLAVKMSYRTPRLPRPEEVFCYPLLLVFHERGWYCLTRDIDCKRYHPRRLDRIKSCSLLKDVSVNESYQEDLKEAQFLLSCGWGMTFPRSIEELRQADAAPAIVVRFAATVAPYLLESLDRHPRGKLSPVRDGTGEVEFAIHLKDNREFQDWVRSFGAKAWFVAPEALVEAERAEVRRMSNRYSPLKDN